MDFSHILEQLRTASLFALYRLWIAIGNELENPERIEQVRRRLHPGMDIRFFDQEENRLVGATVVELHRTRLLVDSHADGKRWSIRFCSVNLEGMEADISPLPGGKGISRNQLRVGDMVGFQDRQNRPKYGRVVGLNQKTATVLTNDNERWRVAYPHLSIVLEGGSLETPSARPLLGGSQPERDPGRQ